MSQSDSYLFFLSYAKDNGDIEEVRYFYKELSKQLRTETSKRNKNLKMGYMDEEIPGGTAWQREIVKALQASHTLVCLFSKSYFDGPWCGREWEVFRYRSDLYLEEERQKGENIPSLPAFILPIIWKHVVVPDNVSHLNLIDAKEIESAFGEEEVFELFHKDNQEKYGRGRHAFIRQLANTIINAQDKSLPIYPFSEKGLLEQVINPFVGETKEERLKPEHDSPSVTETGIENLSAVQSGNVVISPKKTNRVLKWMTKGKISFAVAITAIIAIVSIAIANSKHTESITLEDSDTAAFVSTTTMLNFWTSRRDTGWLRGSIDNVCPGKGRRIGGDTVGFFRTINANGKFNLFQDFILHINTRFTSRKGVMWIIRARDEDNYYLFELDIGRNGMGKMLNFYRNLKGNLVRLESIEVIEDIEERCKQFNIYTQAIGGDFLVFIRPETPDPSKEPLNSRDFNKPVPLGVFHDDSFPDGGVGFSTKQGMEIQLHQMRVMPRGTKEFEEEYGRFLHE